MEKTRSTLFQGLSFPEEIGENAFMTLYKWADMHNLPPGQVLAREDSPEQNAFYVLHGAIQISKKVNGQDVQVAVLGRGEWIESGSLFRRQTMSYTATALEPSVVMTITPTALGALHSEDQLAILKYINDFSQKRIDSLTTQLATLQTRNTQLTDNLFYQRLHLKTDASKSKIVQSIIKKVPRLPAFAKNLALNALGDDYSPTQLSEIIKHDPALVGMILKTINSPTYGFHSKISDIHRAIVLLGSDQISRLLIAEGVRKVMPDSPIFHELHVHTLAISQIAFLIAVKSGNKNPAQVATVGLVHALGEAVIEYIKEHNPSYAEFFNDLDSAQLGAMLFKEWDFPEVLRRCVEYQFYPEFSRPENIPTDILETVTICYLSHCCYDRFRCSQETKPASPFFDEYMALMPWKGLNLEEMIEHHLMPQIIKKLPSYPAVLRKLFKK